MLGTETHDLFGHQPPRPRELNDDELTAILAASIALGVRGRREADLLLATVVAEHLVDALRLAGVTAFAADHA